MIQGSQSSDGPNEFGSFMYSECSAQFQAHSVCEKSGVNMQCALRGRRNTYSVSRLNAFKNGLSILMAIVESLLRKL